MQIGSQLAHRLARTAIERRIGVDQMTQLVSGNLQLDRELENAEEIAAPRTHRRGTHEHPAVGVLNDFDEAIVARSVDPAAGGNRCLLDPGPNVEPLLFRLLLGEAGRAYLGVGKRHARLRAVVGAWSWPAQDVVDYDAGVIDRHVGEAAADGHVADRPEPLTHAEMVVRFEQARRWIEADGFQADVPQVGAASRCSTAPSTALASGSSNASTRFMRSMIETLTPKRAKTCESSTPMAPPPRITRDSGSSSTLTASRFVQYFTRSSPGIGGTAGDVPVAITIAREA